MKLTIKLSRDAYGEWSAEIPALVHSGYTVGNDAYQAIRWAKINALMHLAGEARVNGLEIPTAISFELDEEITDDTNENGPIADTTEPLPQEVTEDE